jgi:hypothetical protein
MVNVDRAWARQAYRYPGKKLSDFRLQVIDATYTIAAGATAQNQAVNFAAGGIIMGVIAACSPTGQAMTQTYRPGLDSFTTAITYQADNRYVVGTAEAHGSAVFGPWGDQFPNYEIVMPQNSALVYSFTSLVGTQTILLTLAHHCLLLGAVG